MQNSMRGDYSLREVWKQKESRELQYVPPPFWGSNISPFHLSQKKQWEMSLKLELTALCFLCLTWPLPTTLQFCPGTRQQSCMTRMIKNEIIGKEAMNKLSVPLYCSSYLYLYCLIKKSILKFDLKKIRHLWHTDMAEQISKSCKEPAKGPFPL